MLKLTKEELIKYFGVSESTINTNFPLFAQKQLKKGFLITKTGVGKKANYTVEKVEKQEVDKSIFSQRGNSKEELKNEIWKTCYNFSNYEVSNFGRVRNKLSKNIFKGTIKKGYCYVELDGKNLAVHRLILQTFNPIENYELLTVDHINGIRDDNRLENLRWCSMEENTMAMMINRAELNKELTRIINALGYEETLRQLQQMG